MDTINPSPRAFRTSASGGWRRYCLYGLAFLVLVCMTLCMPSCRGCRRRKDEQEAIEAIKKGRRLCRVLFPERGHRSGREARATMMTSPLKRAETVRQMKRAVDCFPPDDPATPAFLRRPLGDDFFMTVGIVDLSYSKITDGELECLKALPQVATLSLGGTRISDEGLAILGGLTQLEDLESTIPRSRTRAWSTFRGSTS